LVTAAVALAYRIHAEEELMATELGNRYVKYVAKTKRFIPFVW
jgi:protein-S-isoprenylcysteine O-methyltransferase Ste14